MRAPGGHTAILCWIAPKGKQILKKWYTHYREEIESIIGSLDWKQEKLRGSSVRCARAHFGAHLDDVDFFRGDGRHEASVRKNK